MRHSYTKISTYMKCAFQKKGKYELGIRGRKSPQADRGIEIHKEFENAVQLQLPLPNEFSFYNEYVKKLEGAACELKLGVKRDWFPCDYDDPEAWIVAIVDLWKKVGDKGILLDWKTGKEYADDHFRQRQFYSMVIHCHYPELKLIDATNVYLDYKTTRSHRFTDTDMPDIRAIWERRILRMEADTECVPTPGPYCRWCPVSQREGGPCRF